VEASVPTHQRPREKAPKLQGVIVEHASCLGVGREQDLESPVETEALQPVGPHSSPDPVRRLEDADAESFLLESKGAGEAREPRAHDENVAPCSRHDAAFPRT
jgi:hypothetical protein